MSSENRYKTDMSVTEANLPEDDPCLCQGKIKPEDRMDFQVIRDDPKTGKPKWKTILRYHKNCPEHGIERTPDASGS